MRENGPITLPASISALRYFTTGSGFTSTDSILDFADRTLADPCCLEGDQETIKNALKGVVSKGLVRM